jgi:flavoprotein
MSTVLCKVCKTGVQHCPTLPVTGQDVVNLISTVYYILKRRISARPKRKPFFSKKPVKLFLRKK